MKDAIYVKCDCGCELIEVENGDHKDFWFCIFRYDMEYFTFWRRLKFLFTGDMSGSYFVINNEKAKELAEFLNRNTN
jgi:hypothetical protein